MTIYPCRDCRLSAGCEIKDEKVKAIRGLKLTSIKFRCQKRTDYLKPGMRVKAHLPYVCVGMRGGYDEAEHPIMEPRTLDAVVMAWVHGKVRIYVPQDQEPGTLVSKSDNETQLDVVRVNAIYLEPTGETETVCIYCGLPKEHSAKKWICRTEFDESGPNELDCVYPRLGL
jgi:hypothetical protein